MIRWEVVVVLMLAFADMMLTYYLLYSSKKSGQKNWYDNEQNAIVRYFLKKYGLHNGMRVGAFFSLTIMTGLMLFMNARYNWFDFSRFMFFLIGAYSMVTMYHIIYLKHAIKNGRH
jgi:hypothetical protein